MIERHHIKRYLVLALALLLMSCTSGPNASTLLPAQGNAQSAPATLPDFKHIFVIVDEGDRNTWFRTSCCQEGNGGHIATLVISPLSKPDYQSPIGYDHYSLLRTIENAWGLPELGGAACDCAPPMADFFVPNAAVRR